MSRPRASTRLAIPSSTLEGQAVTFVEKDRLHAGHGERAWLTISWEGEIFGTAMFETMAEKYPELADKATAAANMEWLNVHLAEEFGHETGVHVSLEQAEKLARKGTEMCRRSPSRTWRRRR
jgi:hypothetical protein